jgi:hypothetical protein
MRFHALWPLSKTRLFPNNRGFGVGGQEVMQRDVCVCVCVMGSMLRRVESSWCA